MHKSIKIFLIGAIILFLISFISAIIIVKPPIPLINNNTIMNNAILWDGHIWGEVSPWLYNFTIATYNLWNNNWSTTYNTTYDAKAGAGNCPSGEFVVNTTTGGVQCMSLASTYYNATIGSVITGTIDGGTINDTRHPNAIYDGKTFNFSERVLAPALDLRVNFTGIESFNQGVIRYKTSTLSGGYALIQLWNYDMNTWESYPPLTESLIFATITQPVFDSAVHIQNGVIQMRLYKASNGNTNNHYYIDWLSVIKGFGTPSGEEVDPYSYHKEKDLNSTGYNITASYFFGDGSQLTGIDTNWSYANDTYVPYNGAVYDVELGEKGLQTNDINITQGDYSIYSNIFDWMSLGVLDVIELVGEIGAVWFQDGVTIRGVNNFPKLTFIDKVDTLTPDSTIIFYDYTSDRLNFKDASGGYHFDNDTYLNGDVWMKGNLTAPNICYTNGTGCGGVNLSAVNDIVNSKHLTSDTTLNFTTSDTITAMQTAINAVAKDLNGYTLTINFADGNYTLDAFLDFEGFRNGNIIVQGNTGDSTSLSTAQSVYLDFSGQNSYGLYFNNCMATILVQFLKIKIADNAGKACIYGKNTGKISIYYCYLLSAGKTTSTRAVYGQSAPAYVYNTYVDNFYYGIVEAQCFFVSNNVDSIGTDCNYGLYSVDGGVIGKGGANQPTGTTANELTSTGGVIR